MKVLIVSQERIVSGVIAVVTQWVQYTRICTRASRRRENEGETGHCSCCRVPQRRLDSELFDRHPCYRNQQTWCLLFVCEL